MTNDIITNLHPDNDPNTNLYPNIKKQNIPNKSIDTSKLDDNVISLIGELKPSGTDTSTNILAFTSNKGIYVATDTGHWYYWNGSVYADGGVYQSSEDIKQIKEDLANLSDDIEENENAIFNVEKSVKWHTLTGTKATGWIHKITHVVQDQSNDDKEYETFPNIVGGGTYRYSTVGGGNCCAVLWLDANGNYLSYVDVITAFVYETVEVIAPINATKAIVNNININKGVTKFEIYAESKTKSLKLAEISDTDFREDSRKSLIINSQLSNDYAWKKPNKLYISFVFDDTNKDIDLITDLFKSKGVPCCFATIPSKLDDVCTNGEKARDVLKRAVADGGEVLAHWQSPLTSVSTDEDYENVIVGAKKTLYNAGFEVNGIIVAGGSGYETQDFEKDILLCRPYYKYADLIATGNTNVEQYYNMRQFLTTNTTTNRGYVDDFVADGVIENKGKDGWIIFASHGANDGVTIAILSDLLDYIATKDNVEIVNCNTAFEIGRSSKLEKIIPSVETFVASGGAFTKDIVFRKNGNNVTVNCIDTPLANDLAVGWVTSNVLPVLPVNFRPSENARIYLMTNAGQFGCLAINTAGQTTLYTSVAKAKGDNTNIYGSYVTI